MAFKDSGTRQRETWGDRVDVCVSDMLKCFCFFYRAKSGLLKLSFYQLNGLGEHCTCHVNVSCCCCLLNIWDNVTENELYLNYNSCTTYLLGVADGWSLS